MGAERKPAFATEVNAIKDEAAEKIRVLDREGERMICPCVSKRCDEDAGVRRLEGFQVFIPKDNVLTITVINGNKHWK